jgi:hypothetical protein
MNVFRFESSQDKQDLAAPDAFKLDLLANLGNRFLGTPEEEGLINKDNTEESRTQNLRRSTRERKAPSYLNDYECSIGVDADSESFALSHSTQGHKNKKITYPMEDYVSYNNLSANYKNLCLAISSDT